MFGLEGVGWALDRFGWFLFVWQGVSWVVDGGRGGTVGGISCVGNSGEIDWWEIGEDFLSKGGVSLVGCNVWFLSSFDSFSIVHLILLFSFGRGSGGGGSTSAILLFPS